MIQRPEWVLRIVLDEVHRLPDLCCGEQWLILMRVPEILAAPIPEILAYPSREVRNDGIGATRAG